MKSDEQAPRATWPLLPPAVEVSGDNPFEQDRLGRKAEIEQLTVLIEHTPTPFVLGLDAAWGTGKTTFVRIWRQYLENEGHRTVYFNAWETDYIADPLIALVGEIGSLLPRTQATAQKAYNKLKSTTSLILKKATPIAIRLATAGLVDLRSEDLRGLNVTADDLEKALAEAGEKIVEEAIDKYQQHRDEAREFRKSLECAVAQAPGSKPLVFFIDELDRCRPSFAVEVLERIKHLFEVPGVIFIASVHLEQLAHSVRAIYGHDFDAEGYLGRFFNVVYRLADPSPREYAKYLIRHAGLNQWTAVSEVVVFLMDFLHFSLRQQQRCIARTALVIRLVGQGQRSDNPRVYAALIVIREWKLRLYSQFLSGEKTADDLLEALESVDPYRWKAENETVDIETALLVLEFDRREGMKQNSRFASSWNSPRLRQYKEAAAAETDARSKRIAQGVAGSVQNTEEHYRMHHWRRVLNLLELAGHFQLLNERLE